MENLKRKEFLKQSSCVGVFVARISLAVSLPLGLAHRNNVLSKGVLYLSSKRLLPLVSRNTEYKNGSILNMVDEAIISTGREL